MSRRKEAGHPAAAGLQAVLLDGVRLHQQGRLADAERTYKKVLAQNARQPDALHLLGVIAHQRGDHQRAVTLMDRAIAGKPADPTYHNNRGTALLALGRLDDAEGAFLHALSIAPAYAEAHNNLGNVRQQQGRLNEATDSYRAALAARPGYADAWCNLGHAQHGLGDLDAAESSFGRAVALRPHYVKALRGLGDTTAELGRPKEAATHYAAALAAAPDDGETRAALAALHERAGDLELGLREAEAVLAADPENLRAALVAARCQRRLGRNADALARLDALAVNPADREGRAFVAFEQAAACDRLGQFRRAFTRFAEGNRHLLETARGRSVDRAAFPSQIDTLRRRFTRDWVESWTPPVAAPWSPVFLVGFPRSGTTLLDQVLDAHPGLRTVEEKSMLDVAKGAVAELPGGYPDALATMSADQVRAVRTIYEAEVNRYLPDRGDAVPVDKMPLNIIDMGLIHRLYPEAKVLLALRHPGDVVLSGLMQAFRPNAAMVHFGAIEDTARLYAAVMDLWLTYTDVLPLAVATVRYEDLVRDFETETRRLLGFLELPWDESVRGYRDHARTRAISTPSYHQVVQPLYTRSIGRWRNYRPDIEHVFPVLAPYVEAFGYALEDDDPQPPPPS